MDLLTENEKVIVFTAATSATPPSYREQPDGNI